MGWAWSLCAYITSLTSLARPIWEINTRPTSICWENWYGLFGRVLALHWCEPLGYIEWIATPPQIAKFIGPSWGPPGSCRPQMGPMVAPGTLLSGTACFLAWSNKQKWEHQSSISMDLFERNPPVTNGFPSQTTQYYRRCLNIMMSSCGF